MLPESIEVSVGSSIGLDFSSQVTPEGKGATATALVTGSQKDKVTEKVPPFLVATGGSVLNLTSKS